VLLIDLDGQGNLTERCIPDKVLQANESGEQFPGIVDYFSGQQSLKDLVVPCELQNGASLVPSNPYLTLRDLGGTGRPELEARFVRDVRELCSQHIGSLGGVPDWIIIDTPPAMSVFTRAALAVAEHVLAPIRPRKPSLAGTRNMLQTVDTMNALVGTSATFLGTVVTHWDNLAVSQQFVEITLPNILKGYGGRVFTTMIPFDNQLDEREPGARIRGPKAYEALAEEVITDVNQRRAKSNDADPRLSSDKATVSNEA
jgi:chromosome partitioning protein